MDFYLIFPFLLNTFSFRQGQGKLKKVAAEYEGLRPYAGIPDGRDLMLRMEPIQRMAAEALVKLGFLDGEMFSRGLVQFRDENLDSRVEGRVNELNLEQESLVDLLVTLCSSYDLLGANGLKRRSGLLEYRYDAV